MEKNKGNSKMVSFHIPLEMVKSILSRLWTVKDIYYTSWSNHNKTVQEIINTIDKNRMLKHF